MTLDSSGNLGIGETSPSTFGKLVVKSGTINLVTDTATERRLSFWSTANGNSENAYIQVQNDGGTTNTGEISFATKNVAGTLAERARIDASGNLGIGVTAPTANLQIGAADSSSRSIVIHTANNGDARLRFREGGTVASGYNEYSFGMLGLSNALTFESQGLGEIGRFDSGGSLLIATTTSPTTGGFARAPLSIKQINDTSFGSGIQLEANADTSVLGIGYNGVTFQIGTSYRSTGAYKGISFNVSGAEAVRIDTSGNLLVGNTTKFGGGLTGLDLNSAGATGITFGKSATVKGYFYLTSDVASFVWSTASGTVASVVSNTNGVTLTNGATSWASLSDERKKDIIEPIADAATKVSSLRAVIGKYKTEEDGIRRVMLIAQDVQAVLPEAVVENNDGELLLQYTEIIPLLVAAIKEQSALITQLTARITALEGA